MRDETGDELPETGLVGTRAEMQEDARRRDREDEPAQPAHEVEGSREALVRADTLHDAEEHEREETGHDDPEEDPSARSGQDPRERARRAGGPAALEDRDARRDAADQDVDDPAREQPEAGERFLHGLLLVSPSCEHARKSAT